MQPIEHTPLPNSGQGRGHFRKAAFSRFALPALVAGAAAIGLAPIFVRLSDVGPMAKAFWRLTLSLPLLWTAVRWSLKRRPGTLIPRSAAEIRLLIAAGFFFAADLSVWHVSIGLTTVANATLLPNFAPVFVVLGAWIFLKERVGLPFFTGMAAALAGTVLMVGTSYRIDPGRFLGDSLALATALLYAGYILAVKRLRARFSTAVVMAASGTVTAVSLLAASLAAGERILPQTVRGWAVLASMAVISHAGGQGLIAFALAHLKAGFSSVGLLVQPVVAAVLAWALFGETLNAVQAAGGLLVLAGILLARKDSG